MAGSVGVGPGVVHVITWLIVIAGWVIVHRTTLSRERRREKRDTAKQFLSDLYALEKSAHQFHGAPNYDEYAAAKLRMQCDRLIKILQRTPFNELRISPSLMIALRRAITRNNIDPTAFSPQAANSRIQLDIRYATDDLADAIEIAKASHWI
jgi:hypothetical protein